MIEYDEDTGQVTSRARPVPGWRAPGTAVICVLYLRLSDMDSKEQMTGRVELLRALAKRLGYIVPADGVRIENDMDGDKPKPASAFKRRKISFTLTDGTVVTGWRVLRPEFQRIIAELHAGTIHAMLAEDLDRIARDPRDLEDCIDAAEQSGAIFQSLTPGQVNLTTSDGITMTRVLVAFANNLSRSTASKVARYHTRLHGKSYRGGGAGYGFRYDPNAPKEVGKKRLLHEPAEAEVILDAYVNILDRGLKLSVVTQGLIDAGVPTRRGGQWTQTTLKGALTKPSVAGLDHHGGANQPLVKSEAWEPIVTVERWTAMVARLSPAERRRRGPQPTPRSYLLSGVAVCGECGKAMSGGKTGPKSGREPRYACYPSGHVTRAIHRADETITEAVIMRLSMPDVAGLLRPAPPIATADAAHWRAEIRRIRKLIAAKNAMHTEGLIDDTQATADLRKLRDKLNEAEAALRTPAPTDDPLKEFRTGKPADEVWGSLVLARQTNVLRALVERVVIHKVPPGGRGKFDPRLVEMVWRDAAKPPAELAHLLRGAA
jgi:DNA invertase Pin-like site-specific DNA recombinase